jgi:octaprenyl-diphosphate synthase
MTPPFANVPRLTLPATSFTNIDQVWDAYREELQAVESYIARAVDSRVPVINLAASHLLQSGGKRLRPLLLLLSARLCNHQGPLEDEIVLASAVEFVHAAALLHDDVLDEAALRRGHETARLLWGNKASILVGDYLYTRAIDQVIRLGNSEIETTLVHAVREMVEGEMLQFSLHHNINITETDCLTVIDYKTASLMSAACALAAILSGAQPAQIAALTCFGRRLGVAFQVADDALDYLAQPDKLGKTIGKDLCEGKITLPLFHLLAACDAGERAVVERIIGLERGLERGFKRGLDGELDGAQGVDGGRDLGAIIALMERHGSVPYALDRSRHFIGLALEELRIFPPSSYRDAMELIADYVVSRDH